MWAYDFGPDKEFPEHLYMYLGEKWWVELHGLEEPLVEVLVTEDPEGPYYGWLETGEEQPSMIWPSKIQFTMCFPYGPKVEEERDKGVSLRFNINNA